MELKELTLLRGVSGDEGAVRDCVLKRLSQLPVKLKTDRMGNVLAEREGPKGAVRVMLSAHMDEVGLIALGANELGLIAYGTVGGIDPRVMVSKRVLVGKDALHGVIGSKAIHLQSRDERTKPLSHKELFVDIGAKDKEEAEKLVKPGDYLSFDSDYVEFGDGFIKAKALDDRVGVYNMLRLLENEYPVQLSCAFTVQEEVGLRGAGVAARQILPDCAIVLECTAAGDLGKVPGTMQVANLGKGVAVSFMDRASVAHPGLSRALCGVGDKYGIPWQIKRFVSGGNDAGAIQRAAGAIPVCPVSVPCRYIHSPSNVAAKTDIEAQYALIDRFLRDGASFEKE